MVTNPLTDGLTALHTALDGLLAADLTGLSADELLEGLRGFEGFRRRLSVLDHRLVAEVVARNLAGTYSAVSAGAVLRHVLRISPGEAAGRVRAAADLGPRHTLHGDVLPPLFGRVAAAQAAGVISPIHARIITDAVDALPAALQAEHDDTVETELVHRAGEWDPVGLRRCASRLLDILNPDGTLADDADHQRRRDFALIKHCDGSAAPVGRFSPP